MKALINTITLLIIIAANYLTGTFESANDGWNIVGFPFIFYKSTAAKLDLAGSPERNYFSLGYLIADIFIYVVIIVIVNSLYSKFKGRYNKVD